MRPTIIREVNLEFRGEDGVELGQLCDWLGAPAPVVIRKAIRELYAAEERRLGGGMNIDIRFYEAQGECMASRQWPAVPRIGDNLTLTELSPKHWQVVNVVWGSTVRGDDTVIRDGLSVSVTCVPIQNGPNESQGQGGVP